MEDIKVSEDYKKAFNQADMICTYMPHLLKGMTIPEHEPSEYTKGFQDRIAQFEQERSKFKDISMDEIRKTYGNRGKEKESGKEKGMDRD